MRKLNEYLSDFLGATASENIGETELNEILLNGVPNGWSNQVYVQGFDCEYKTFFKAFNIFERM